MSIKKIVHLGDIHIRTYRLHDEYKEVFTKLFKDLTALLSEYKREEIRIVIAGDLVHQKIIISNEQLLLGTWFLRKLEEIAPVIIIAGNHDLLENNKERMDSITPMVQFLPDKDINFFKESKCFLDNNVVWCVYSIFEENARPDIEGARKQFGNDKTYIGLYHAPIMNAKTDIGYSIDHGDGLEIFEGLDCAMLGDIHKHQLFIHNNIHIVYPSSLIQQNFGESVSRHGFVLWDIDSMTCKHIPVENNNPYYNFRITSIKDIENNAEKIINL